MATHNPQTEEIFHIAGDAPDPMGGGLRGQSAGMRMDKAAQGHPLVRYKDTLIEVDVYTLPDQPIWLHLLCPKCRHGLKITAERKHILWEPTEGPPQDQGRLSVEKFECTWEGDNGEVRQTFVNNLCRWRVAIDNNIARDA